MGALGALGLTVAVAIAIGAVFLFRHFRPASGRHAFVSRRIESAVLEDDKVLEETIILGNLFGTIRLNGYAVDEADREGASTSGSRPYLDYYWRQREEDRSTEISAFGWFDGLRKESEDPPLAIIR